MTPLAAGLRQPLGTIPGWVVDPQPGQVSQSREMQYLIKWYVTISTIIFELFSDCARS